MANEMEAACARQSPGHGSSPTGGLASLDWPMEEQPIERLFAKGESHLTDSELLALVLGSGEGRRRCGTLDLARTLLADHEGLRGLARAGAGELIARKGMGRAKVSRLKAALEIGRRLASHRIQPGGQIRSSRDVYVAFSSRLRDVRKEVFYVVLLDGKNRTIKDVRVSEGSLTMSLVHPREVYHPVIREAAAGVIFVHNHPSGDPSPSPEDIEITRRLAEVGKILGIRVVDHVIVGEDSYTSFAEQGYPL